MQATMQDEEVGESEWDELAEEEPEVVAKAVELLTVGKGKWKAVPARASVQRGSQSGEYSAEVVINMH
jgi:hypothetical protein